MGLADILWKAGVDCYGTPVTTAGRVHRESTKNVYSLLRKIRLTSYVGLNAGIVYNSDPTSRISNYQIMYVLPPDITIPNVNINYKDYIPP